MKQCVSAHLDLKYKPKVIWVTKVSWPLRDAQTVDIRSNQPGHCKGFVERESP